MALRVIEIIIPREDKKFVQASLEEQRVDERIVYWMTPLEDESTISFKVVLRVGESENVLDRLEGLFSWGDKYRVVVYPAEATLPRLKADEPKQPEASEDEKKKNAERISREELYNDVLDTTSASTNFILLAVFSAIVAIIGLMRDSVAMIIGAMILAPLLGPNVGLSLAATLGDFKLARESMKTLAIGVGIVFLLSLSTGVLFDPPTAKSELLSRSVTSYSDIILALISGSAGIISFTMGVPTSLVGVMVALSLLPPLVSCGLFFGFGLVHEAFGAGLLFLANIICLNLSGVLTFILQGVYPLKWWEKERARSLTIKVSLLWVLLLLLLVAILYHRIAG